MGEVEEEEEGGSRRKVRVTVLEREGEDMEASFSSRTMDMQVSMAIPSTLVPLTATRTSFAIGLLLHDPLSPWWRLAWSWSSSGPSSPSSSSVGGRFASQAEPPLTTLETETEWGLREEKIIPKGGEAGRGTVINRGEEEEEGMLELCCFFSVQ